MTQKPMHNKDLQREESAGNRCDQHDDAQLVRHMRQNPRLVFTDPDDFFTDLLMEQEEQG